MYEHSITRMEGLALLAGYGLVMIGLTLIVSWRRDKTKKEFLLADRGVGFIAGAMSIAASWIWAPAMFVSSQKTYQQGLAGLFWYLVPNIATLMLFGPFAARLRALLPDGYTLPQYMKARHGRAVHFLYVVQFLSLQICALAVQVLAISQLMSVSADIPFPVVGAVVLGMVLVYALVGGLRASVATDYLQMIAMIVVCAIAVPWAISSAGGLSVVASGIGGVTGEYQNPLHPWVFYSFGISITIGLLSGPLGDQMQWQRAFALSKTGRIKSTYILGALLFGCVPLALCNLGFISAAKVSTGEWAVPVPEMVAPTTISHLLPHYMIIVFIIMVMAGLCSTLDSSLCAIASLVATDIYGSTGDVESASHTQSVLVSRISMVFAAVAAFLIAQIPHLQVLHLFLFYGTLRASTMIPTVFTLTWSRLSSRAIFLTIFCSLLLGAPLMAAGHYFGNPHLSVAGSLSVVAVGLGGCLVGARPRDKPGQGPSRTP